MSLFPSIFASLPFSLCIGEEYVMLRMFPLSGGLFLPCGHGLDFWHQLRAVLVETKSCTKEMILAKIFPTRFRFTFHG